MPARTRVHITAGTLVSPDLFWVGRRFSREAIVAVVIGLVAVTFATITANVGMIGAQTAPSGATWACQSFPLCSGEFMPKGSGIVHTDWSYRLVAYLLLFHVLGATIAIFRRGAPRRSPVPRPRASLSSPRSSPPHSSFTGCRAACACCTSSSAPHPGWPRRSCDSGSPTRGIVLTGAGFGGNLTRFRARLGVFAGSREE